MRTYSSNTRAALVVAITVLATTGMAGAEHVKPNKPKVSCYPTYKTTKACINGYRVSCTTAKQPDCSVIKTCTAPSPGQRKGC